MKRFRFILMVIPLALASASRVTSLDARESGTSTGTPAAVDSEQPADVLLHQRNVDGGWRRVAANETKLVIVRGRQGRGFRKGAPAKCVPAAACRRRKVICVKRCYTAASRLARVPPAIKCVIRCKKCVPTC